MGAARAEQSGETRGRGRLTWWIAAAAMVVFGFGLRAAFYHGGYGHPDETITVEVVRHMRQSGDLDTNWAKAPTLGTDLRYDQYNFSSHLYATYWFYRFVKLVPGTLGWRSEDEGFWVYRFFSVLLATLVVGQAMRLAERNGGRTAALGAGLLTAGAVQLVQDAHYSRPEAFVTALTMALVAIGWPREKLSLPAVAGAALTVGLLVACKVSMALLAWLPLVPVFAAWRGGSGRVRGWALVMVPVGGLAGFVAGAPGAVANPAAFVNGIEFLMNQYAGLHPPHSHLNGGRVADMVGAYYVATLGWPLLACGAVGVGVRAGMRGPDGAVTCTSDPADRTRRRSTLHETGSQPRRPHRPRRDATGRDGARQSAETASEPVAFASTGTKSTLSRTPHSGQFHPFGTAVHGVPGSTPLWGSPARSS